MKLFNLDLLAIEWNLVADKYFGQNADSHKYIACPFFVAYTTNKFQIQELEITDNFFWDDSFDVEGNMYM